MNDKKVIVKYVETPVALDKLAMTYANFFLEKMCQKDTKEDK